MWDSGHRFVVGVDEAGRGPLAGPVVAAAVVFPFMEDPIPGVTDSKQLSHEERITLFPVIQEKSIDIGIGIIDCTVIDQINILQATFRAMSTAISMLEVAPEFILIDGNGAPCCSYPLETIIHGDALCFSISAASIIAKVVRDEIMVEYDAIYPGYGFAQHKGYATELHVDCLRKLGLSPIHRRSFRPKELLDIY